jgi:hypothetical protein
MTDTPEIIQRLDEIEQWINQSGTDKNLARFETRWLISTLREVLAREQELVEALQVIAELGSPRARSALRGR